METYDIFTVRQYYPSEQNPTASNWVYEQVAGIKKYGINSLVISPTPYIPTILRKQSKFNKYPPFHNTIKDYKDTNVIRSSFVKVPKMLFFSLTLKNFSKAIMKAAENSKAKLIHAHFGYEGVAALPLKRRLNVPIITTFYGGDIRRFVIKKPDLYKDLIKKGDLFLGISNVMVQDLKKLGFPDEKICLWYLGVKLDTFQPKIKEDNGKKFRFVTVSRFSESKGVQYGLDAFCRVHKRYPDSEYIVAGFGPYEKTLKDLATRLKLKDSVKFINNLECPDPRGVVLREMRDADVLIHPTTPAKKAREGTPLVLIEAQACGTPCISTDFAGIPEVVIDNKTGFIIPTFNTEKLVEKMIYLMEHPSVRKTFGKAARKHIEKEFDQQRQIKKLVSMYKEFIG